MKERVTDPSTGVAMSQRMQAMSVKLVARMLGQFSNWSVHLELSTLTPHLTNKLPDNGKKPGTTKL